MIRNTQLTINKFLEKSAELNVAIDSIYVEEKSIIDKKENDLYDIKHELVAAQMKLQSADKKK